MSVTEFEDLRQHSYIFEQISVIFPVPTALTGGERVERVEMLGTSPSYFDMLRAKPALGRAYTQADWVPGFLDPVRSEEHTSELQSRFDLVCRLLLEKKKKTHISI